MYGRRAAFQVRINATGLAPKGMAVHAFFTDPGSTDVKCLSEGERLNALKQAALAAPAAKRSAEQRKQIEEFDDWCRQNGAHCVEKALEGNILLADLERAARAAEEIDAEAKSQGVIIEPLYDIKELCHAIYRIVDRHRSFFQSLPGERPASFWRL